MMLLSLLILQAAAGAASISSVEKCEQSVSRVVGSARDGDTRVVITFTGSQRALLPLDERIGGAAESTLFPIGADSFILTIQVRPSGTSLADGTAFAKHVCSIGTSSGGRFNGVLSFVRESMVVQGRTVTRDRMTNAAMARLPSN